jgi:hypothetical protein
MVISVAMRLMSAAKAGIQLTMMAIKSSTILFHLNISRPAASFPRET